jgi:hypothetical protein
MEKLTFSQPNVESSKAITKYVEEHYKKYNIPFFEFEVIYTSKDFYQIVTNCACADENHRLLISLECNKDGSSPTISFDFQVGHYFYERFWDRIKCAAKILFFGYDDVNESFIFRGREQLVQLINVCIAVVNKFEDENQVNLFPESESPQVIILPKSDSNPEYVS